MLRRLVFWAAACACGVVSQGCGGSSDGQSAPPIGVAGTSSPASAGTSASQQPAQPPAGGSVAGVPGATAGRSGAAAGMTGAAAGMSGTGAGMTGTTAGMSGATAGVTGASAGMSGAGAAGSSGSGGTAAPTGPGGGERIPCDVAAVLGQRCLSCHGPTLNLGAPMPLVTWSDLHLPAVSDASKKVYELVGVRVKDTVRPMPPKQEGKIAVADQTLLVNWSEQGAPPLASSAPACP